ncbi:MAG TPA: uroporphyrinogen decarboxylase family protein, partial [Trueperaceae bacterium]
VDWRTPLDRVRRSLPRKVLQGNLDPAALLGPRDVMLAEARAVLRAGLGGPHVFNLGHGVLQQTDPDQVAALVDEVRSFDRHAAGMPAVEDGA